MHDTTFVQSIHQALMSMMQVYPHRNLSADDWRTGSLFSIISTPAIMLNPALTDKVKFNGFYLPWYPTMGTLLGSFI